MEEVKIYESKRGKDSHSMLLYRAWRVILSALPLWTVYPPLNAHPEVRRVYEFKMLGTEMPSAHSCLKGTSKTAS